jgi:hypothetical protein
MELEQDEEEIEIEDLPRLSKDQLRGLAYDMGILQPSRMSNEQIIREITAIARGEVVNKPAEIKLEKIYQLRGQGGASEDFWPMYTASTFEGAVEAFKKHWSEISEEGDVFPADFDPQETVGTNGYRGFLITLPGFPDYFIHVVEVDKGKVF